MKGRSAVRGRQKGKVRQRALGAVAVILLALQACGDSTEDAKKLAEHAGRCSINSDCQPDLVCAFERCHEACREDRDCIDLGGGRCVKAPGQLEPGVCQLNVLKTCTKDDDCPGKQLCAIDGECRDTCFGAESCVSEDLSCSTSGYCARANELTNGELPGAAGAGAQPGSGGSSGKGGGSSGSSGEGGDSNEGGEGGSDGGKAGNGAGGGSNSGSGGTLSEDGAGGEGGSPSSGAGGTTAASGGDSGAGGTTAASGGDSGAGGTSAAGGALGAGNGGTAGTVVGGNGGYGGGVVEENEPNDDRDDAIVIEPGVDVLGSLSVTGDVDFYELTAPGEPAAGGYFELGVTDLAAGQFTLRLWSKAAATVVDQYTTVNSGDSAWAFLAAAPGESYLVEITTHRDGQPHPYRLVSTFVPMPDTFEPNDSRDEAPSITLGESVDAYLFTGHRANTIAAQEYFDWYEVELQPGQVTVALTSVPSGVGTHVYLLGLQGQTLHQTPQIADEADNILTYNVQTGGTHWVRIEPYSPAPVSRGRLSRPGEVPDNLVDPYTLTVTQ